VSVKMKARGAGKAGRAGRRDLREGRDKRDRIPRAKSRRLKADSQGLRALMKEHVTNGVRSKSSKR
jgi:hypothetical protein